MEATHTFPLPDAESEKLSAVAEELSLEPARLKFQDTVRSNPFPFVLISLALGFFLGKLLRIRYETM
jgi:hypothetical protein